MHTPTHSRSRSSPRRPSRRACRRGGRQSAGNGDCEVKRGKGEGDALGRGRAGKALARSRSPTGKTAKWGNDDSGDHFIFFEISSEINLGIPAIVALRSTRGGERDGGGTNEDHDLPPPAEGENPKK